MAFAPSQPQRVYVTLLTTAREGQPWNGGVYRSDDAGQTWQPSTGNLPQRVGPDLYQQSNYGEIVVDPRNAEVVYVGGRSWWNPGVYKTTDGGRSWQWLTVHDGARWVNMDYGWITFWGCAVECLAISPVQPDCLAFGTGGHLFVTTDGGQSWQQRYCVPFPDGRFRGNGLEVTCVNAIVPDPVRLGRLYFCYADIGLLISDDGGQTFWRSQEGMRAGGNCFTVAVDPQCPGTLWATTGQWAWNEGYLCRSEDGGKTWRVVGDPASGLPKGQMRHLVLDLSSPIDGRRLLVTVNGHGFFESRDGGTSWQSLNGNLAKEATERPRGLLLNPQDPAHLLAACAGPPETGAGLYETRDGGRSWRRLQEESLFPDLQSLVADPRDFQVLYGATREFYDPAAKRLYPGGVFQSTDGGRTWQRLLDHHFVSAVVVHPADSRLLYAATTDHPYHDDCVAEGVLKSEDRGKTWRRVNGGLSHRNLSCLALDPHDPTVLYAGSGGNSAFVGKDFPIWPQAFGRKW